MDWMESMMTESSPATRRLHNFILPSDLKWGNQRQLRCGKFDLDEEISAAVDDHRRCFSSMEVFDSLNKRKKKEKFIYDPSLVSSGFKKVGFDVKAVTFTVLLLRPLRNSNHQRMVVVKLGKFDLDEEMVSSGFKKVGFDVKAVTFTPPPIKKFKSSENGGGEAGEIRFA